MISTFFSVLKEMYIKILTQVAKVRVLINLIQSHAFYISSYTSAILYQYLHHWAILKGFTQCQKSQDSTIKNFKNYMVRFCKEAILICHWLIQQASFLLTQFQTAGWL